MENLNKLADVIENILRENEQARNSDDLLYVKVLEREDPHILTHSVSGFLQNFNDYGVPRFESVTRVRRKVQAQNPELASAKKVKSWREDRETAIKDFSRMEVRA